MSAGTVLYIEDNHDNMLLVRRILESRGIECLWAPTGTRGLAAAETLEAQVVLLDINLPDIDGYEVARRIRAAEDERLRALPIIAITANALKGDEEKALAAGCDLYLAKPLNLRELLTQVARYIPASR